MRNGNPVIQPFVIDAERLKVASYFDGAGQQINNGGLGEITDAMALIHGEVARNVGRAGDPTESLPVEVQSRVIGTGQR